MRWNEKLARFLMGRYGNDRFNTFLLAIAVFFFILNVFFRSPVLWIIGLVVWGYSVFRLMSRNIYRRRAEENAYLKRRNKIVGWVRYRRQVWRDRKTYRYFNCPKCKTHLRVPKGSGKVCITCRKCGHEFRKKA